MKKRAILAIFILLFSLSFVLAEDNITTDSSIDKINNAYNCLTDKVSGECGSLSIEEKIFSVMATGECKDELITESLSGECWPNSGCKIKTTAQAILALDKTTKDTKGAEEWLLSETTSPSDIEWYLQIDSKEETTCKIKYDGTEYTTILDEDKTFTTNAGTCLSLSSEDYWLKVSQACSDKEFEINCDKDFQTNLLFKLQTSSIFHVYGVVNGALADGRTLEKIKSSCFKEGGKCIYEGSLWAALVLQHKGYDIEEYLPYLMSMAEKNPQLLPGSFLYSLTAKDDFRTDLFLKQKANKYWDETGDKFYDTSVALLGITDEPTEKVNSKNWLLEIQSSDGCWQGNIRNTAFVLASIWPRHVAESTKGCTSSGYFCLNELNCEGNILDGYDCPGISSCCDTPKTIQSCADQTGEICTPDENCVGGTSPSASDTQIGEVCCVAGTCEIPVVESACESSGGRCRIECSKGEVQEYYDCDFPGDICCVAGEPSGSLWWLWFLIILIILTVVGIIFRDKLRMYWFKISAKFSKPKPGPGPRPGMPMAGRPVQRRILPPSQLGRRPPVRRPPLRRPPIGKPGVKRIPPK